jgi:C-terminal processing protease CtpA/Prc
MKDSPAEKAGLKAGDVITSIGDRKIEDSEDLVRTINYYNPNEEIEVVFHRKGQEKEVTAILDKKPAYSWTVKKGHGPKNLEWVSEGDTDVLLIKEKSPGKTVTIKKAYDDELIDITEEILIF